MRREPLPSSLWRNVVLVPWWGSSSNIGSARKPTATQSVGAWCSLVVLVVLVFFYLVFDDDVHMQSNSQSIRQYTALSKSTRVSSQSVPFCRDARPSPRGKSTALSGRHRAPAAAPHAHGDTGAPTHHPHIPSIEHSSQHDRDTRGTRASAFAAKRVGTRVASRDSPADSSVIFSIRTNT